MSAAEKHPDRSTYLGSHAFSTIVGKNPFASPMDLYCQALKLVEPIESTEQMNWGLRLENSILDHYSERHDNIILARNLFKYHNKIKFIGGTADGINLNTHIGVDAKNIAFNRGDWGDPGTSEVPLYISAQCHHFNMLFDVGEWHVAVLQHGQKYEEYIVERDPEMDEVIIDTLANFWENNIQAQVPPEMDGSKGSKSFLKYKFPQHEGPMRKATQEEIDLLDSLHADIEEFKNLESIIDQTENILKGKIGTAEGLLWGKSKVTWKTQKGRESFDKKGLELRRPDLAKEFTTRGNPTRVFRKTFKD